ncbi:MBL fold metallo-hydrolase [Bacillus cereus]|uniref:MBL fold metallo-hydrolase n=2 Tax=Bacillus cereus TaxID=1396 RepID=A0A2C1YFF6_BACCE|nr:MBL fold metallo-hydrolase [Bacillus cereus]PEQ48461.1 MBL fold metallo-hydrolase [Bacillus cereus]PEX39136.1 MBL fold metallo-hydrolase [Bacillus cereus]PFB15177.1 MBL fold metallo-hydrolase [Bacillus cereus]PFC75857.1 MBL fold metallo-hydrolase [Bacillus cereus]
MFITSAAYGAKTKRGSMMRIEVWGGAGEYGRSCYFVKNKEKKIVFDCGINRSYEDSYPKIDREVVPYLDAVFLSHIHEDHTMGLPLLAKYGYKKKIWTTRYTKEQLPTYYEKWRNYNLTRGWNIPYSDQNIKDLNYVYIDEISNPNEWIQITPSLRFQWGYSGHVLGAVWFLVDMSHTYVFYSGDYSAESNILRANLPEKLRGDIKVAIVDAAYHTDDVSQHERVNELCAEIERAAGNKGIALLPLPPLGRAQDIVLYLYKKYKELPIIVDQEILAGFEEMIVYKDWIKNNEELEELIESLKRNVIVMDDDIDTQHSYGIFVMSDANMQTKRAQLYYEQILYEERNSIIFTGHIAKGSFAEKVLKERVGKECRVKRVPYKVHQSIRDVKEMLNTLLPEHTVLVHALKEDTDRLQKKLSIAGYDNVYSLAMECVEVI